MFLQLVILDLPLPECTQMANTIWEVRRIIDWYAGSKDRRPTRVGATAPVSNSPDQQGNSYQPVLCPALKGSMRV